MPWILLLLATLFTAPLSAATLPGVPAASAEQPASSEPDLEKKRPPMRRWPMCWKTMPPAEN